MVEGLGARPPVGVQGATPPGLAPAKINLCLHVTGRRADGYHLLDSLAVFAAVGDMLSVSAADRLTLDIDGPFAAGLGADGNNLVLRAALALAGGKRMGARLHLEKRLPVASGIGGGSADAAAALRLLARLWSIEADLPAIALTLGADVPVCLDSVPARMRGIGEVVEPVVLPGFGLALVNPGIGVATAAVFAALARTRTGWSVPLAVPPAPTLAELVDWLRHTGNDLQAPAMALWPTIGEAIDVLEATPGCLIARMSGSGATCFGVFDTAAAAASVVTPKGWWRWAGAALHADGDIDASVG